ncbi:MAG: SpoIVB peptidase [Bacillaceae bacterium]|nr:SpoIVB peptidase [Bacillaceae bacterium]
MITVLVVCSPPFQQFASIPGEIRLFEGSLKTLNFSMPVTGQYQTTNPNVVEVNGTTRKSGEVNLNEPIKLKTKHAGNAKILLKWGMIPFKSVEVNVLPDIKVYPGGESIGVKLKSAGVMVVGHHLVQSGDNKISPAKEAGIQTGDLIVRINGRYIHDLKEVSELVNEAGQEGNKIKLEILRGKEKKEIAITPVQDRENKKYQLGIYIRDESAGVGTLTFYHPETRKFGALGHVISDIDTGKPIVVGDGYIVRADVSSIEKGLNGSPGEKFASFKKQKLGKITGNTPFGIFGKMNQEPDFIKDKKAMPIALSEQVKEGPARILTVVEGQKVESFDIEIVNVIQQRYPATKGMIIKVTDPDLLDKTGGIVQGMSGSPIIQDGKIVGAVTHVFVNDPTSGYGAFIEWMLKDAGINLSQTTELKAS